MKRILGGVEGLVYAVLRIVAGAMFACHGAQKLFGVLGGHSMVHVPLMLAAGIIEFAGGILIALGVLTSLIALIASGEMAVAYFTQHLPHGFWPIVNHGELAVLYCFVFLFMAARGTGRYGIQPT
ncbi:MAG TPA: DoxX family protein [Terriglobales bacterium]